MANLINIIAHLVDDVQRQRHLTRMQQLRNETAAHHMVKVATVIQGGASLNAMKGTAPFVFRNASQGMATMMTGGTPLSPVRVYTPVPGRARR
jgi:hypothetical protein